MSGSTISAHSDSDLAPRPDQECAEGAAELTEYFGENYSDLVGYAITIVRDFHLAEDIVQEAFANSLAALKRGTSIRNHSLWAHRCIRNLAMSSFRSPPTDPLESQQHLSAAGSTAETIDAREQLAAVLAAVDELPEHFRTAFLLSEVRGLNYREIAGVMNRSASSAAAILHRARNRVREMANPDGAALFAPLFGAGALSNGGRWLNGIWLRLYNKACDLGNWISQVIGRGVDQAAAPALAPVVAAVVLLSGLVSFDPRSAGSAEDGVLAAGPSATLPTTLVGDRQGIDSNRTGRNGTPSVRIPVGFTPTSDELKSGDSAPNSDRDASGRTQEPAEVPATIGSESSVVDPDPSPADEGMPPVPPLPPAPELPDRDEEAPLPDRNEEAPLPDRGEAPRTEDGEMLPLPDRPELAPRPAFAPRPALAPRPPIEPPVIRIVPGESAEAEAASDGGDST